MRRHLSLAGSWKFHLDPEGTGTLESLDFEREIPVPLPWQAAFPELRQYDGYAWYERGVRLEEDWLKGELLLHFGAVDYWCQVFVNGQLVGEHEGGYTSFSFPIASHTRPGENSIAVRVYDPVQDGLSVPRWPHYDTGAGASGPPFDARHIPHGKQEWYINVGGIWQDVTLTAVPACHLDGVRIVPDIHTGKVEIAVELAGDVSDEGEITLLIEDVARVEEVVPLLPGQRLYKVSLELGEPTLWSPDNPHLYTVQVSLKTEYGADELRERFGFREITSRQGKLFLNGEPLFLLSALDQDLYPETIYTVPSVDYLRDQFQKAIHLGFNSLRCHIKPSDPRYLELADEMGLLIWAEVPSWRTFTHRGTTHLHQVHLNDAIKDRVKQTLEATVRRDFNHPSLIIWTIVNEDWGTALPMSPEDRAWVAEMYAYCKVLDPTRLVVDNSPCPHPWGPNIHVSSDIDDFHLYANIPDQAKSIEGALEQFALRPLWSYSSHGDTSRSGQEPLILSEFGNWGMPSLASAQAYYDGDPPWFDLGPWWSPWEGEPGWPMGVAERFEALGLDRVWCDYECFAEATQWHQFEALKFQIDIMRRLPTLAGYVVTELTDAYWESNGLLDFQRAPKAYHDLFRTINSPDAVVPEASRYSYWDDERAALFLHASRYSRRGWQGAELRWKVGEAGTEGAIVVGELGHGEVKLLGARRFELPRIEEAQTVPFHFVLENASGHELARNSFEPYVLPAATRPPRYQEPVVVITRYEGRSVEPLDASTLASTPVAEPAGEGAQPLSVGSVGSDEGTATYQLTHSLRSLGYRVHKELTSETKVVVSTYPNAALLEWVRSGGDLLFLSRGPSPFFWVQSRGGAYSGGWISSFSWLRPEVHQRLSGVRNPLGLPFMEVMPRNTILGLPLEDKAVQSDFLAGMVAGWVRHPAVHTVQFRYGRGRVIMTTFELEAALPRDPVAVAMFHDLLEHLTSDACQPTLKSNY